MMSRSLMGLDWKSGVGRYWDQAVNSICESCCRRLFLLKWNKHAGQQYRHDVRDLVDAMTTDDTEWAKLLYDVSFAHVVRTRVKDWEPTEKMKESACTCSYVSIFSIISSFLKIVQEFRVYKDEFSDLN